MCDTAMCASTSEEMIAEGMKHIEVAHPEMAADIKSMPQNDPKMVAWYAQFAKDWEATPENK